MVNLERRTDYQLESAEGLRSIEEYELESSNLEVPIDVCKPELREELAETSERELTTSGRRYPLREREAPRRYVSRYSS